MEPIDMTHMAALVLVGTELIRGRPSDQNREFMTQQLHSISIQIRSVHIVRDDVGHIAELVQFLWRKVAYVFTVGGLGPTLDDVTLEGVASGFGLALESVHPDDVAAYARMSGSETVKPLLRHRPVGSELIQTDHGPIVKTINVYSLPGLPRLVRARFPTLLGRLGSDVIHSRSLSLSLPQSRVAPVLERAAEKFKGVTIGCYPSSNLLDGVSLIFEGRDIDDIDKCLRFVETSVSI
jgi:molybdopterin-biosynthesis enzyme MoeA-like protein